ncbi:MAG: SusC/RagA family TonB-linked outer membrane protein [Bacteroidota bacterium]
MGKQVALFSDTPASNKDNIQQPQSVTGTITDEDGNPLPGVNINVKGTTQGAISDANGNYTINVDDPDVTLVFSFIGMLTQEVIVGNQTIINVILESDVLGLEEVVVVGYGTARRKDIAGAVSTVRLEDSPIALSPSTNVLQPLQGGVAGVQIGTQNSPGTTPSIMVRGQNSINGSNDPLIVLDGIIYIGSLSDINPEDIAVIDVLKDASAAAVYGSRSANGVLVITTKKGKTDKPVIRYNTSFGMNTWQNPPDMMNLERWTEKYVAQTPSIDSPADIVFDDVTRTELFAQGVDTDWMDLISRNGFFQNHQLAVSGRSDRVNYYFSGGYNSHEGAIVGDDYERISVRSRLNADITDWLEVGVDGTYNSNDYSGIGAYINHAYMHAPHGYPYRWESMPYNVGSATGTTLERWPTGGSIPNTLWGTDGTIEDIDKRNFFRFASYALFKVPHVEGLTYRLNYSINSNFNIQDRFAFEKYYVGEQLVQPFYDRYSTAELQKRLSQANGYNNRTNSYTYVIDNIVNYKKQLGDHYVDATLVATRDLTYTKGLDFTGSGFTANGNTLLGVDGLHKATVQKGTIDIVEKSNIGYLGRVSYAFKNKYHLTASMRRDGSSVFGIDKKWGNFPSAGIAWTVSEEEFISGIDKINYLKVKASYGKNGNQGVGPYGTLARVASGSDGGIRYEFGDAPSTILYGVRQSTLPNPNLGWETTTSFNGGFQSALFNNRVFLDLDFYFSETTDQIFIRQIPIMTGFQSVISSLGQVDNRGLEISLRTINISGDDFKWSSGLIFWRNRNILAELYGDDLDGDGKEDDDLSNNLFIGKSLGAIYGYEYDGVVQESDTEYITNTGASPGDAKFKDLNGDDIITADSDRKILGYRKENFRLSFSNTVEYKNFTLYVMITGIFGGGKDNYYVKENPRYNSFRNRFDTNEIDHDWWTPENKSEEFLRPDFIGNRYLGLQSRGFLKIQDINLSYKLPKDVFSGIGVSSLELYASLKNLYTATGWYGGGDPELGIAADQGTYPVPTIYSMGLKVSF